jgi:predicted XRE-type DNA-binding protein
MGSRREDEGSEPIRGSGNYLSDRGYADPDEAKLKFLMANEVALIAEARGLSQAKVAELTGLAQPDVSRIVNGVVRDYSVMRLMRVLNCLGKDIHIGWSDAAHGRGMIVAGTTGGPEDGRSTQI